MPCTVWGETGDLSCTELIPILTAALAVCVVITIVCLRFTRSWIIVIMLAFVFSYASYLMLLLVISAIKEEMDETIMWLPIIVFFGALFMAPLAAGGILGTVLLSGLMKPKGGSHPGGDNVG